MSHTRLRRRWAALTLLATAALALVLFVWRLGATGLVDETPPLFAASARAMAEGGDWLVPQVNGLPRYDKPPLVYWLMGVVYALPGQGRWDPLGSWAAALPSALACGAVMLLLADTLLRWPATLQPTPTRMLRALAAALAFALAPLVLLWGRIGVSDALFTACVSASLVLAWRTHAAARPRWWPCWVALALAVLTKGPVAVVLVGVTLLLFGLVEGELPRLVQRLRPLRGLALSGLIALPWYGLVLLREGRPYWDSFFGYHNLQRFTAVVNHHLQPWWYFGAVLVAASLPLTPLLLLGLARSLAPSLEPGASLPRFAACWLLVVLGFFTLAATKLPSYWLPATPAAALLIVEGVRCGLEASSTGPAAAADAPTAAAAASGKPAQVPGSDPALAWAWGFSLALTALLGAVFLAGPWWVPLIRDPELPTLPAGILASGRLPLAGGCFLLATVLGAGAWLAAAREAAGPEEGSKEEVAREGAVSGRARRRLWTWPAPLVLQQLPLVLFVPLALLPLWALGDRLRGEPVRALAAVVTRQARGDEPLAMVGILKPSLHFYARRVVVYEGVGPQGPLNLAERLAQERRRGQAPSTRSQQPTVLVVIDGGTAATAEWRDLAPVELARRGPYRLWRLERRRLEQRAQALAAGGVAADWQRPRPERY